jgi:hypothetical protein
MRTSTTTHRQEFFPSYNARLKHLGRFLSKENCLVEFGCPCQLHVLALCVKSNRASQAAVVVEGEREHCARVPGWRGDTPRVWWKGGESVPPSDGSLSVWGRSMGLDSQKVKRDRLC